jgi:transmembrane sensor
MNDNLPVTDPVAPSPDHLARQWFVRMRGDASDDLQDEFRVWLQEAPAHSEAYRNVERHFALAESLKASSIYGRDRHRALRSHRPASKHKGWIAGIVAIAATLLLMVWITFPAAIGLHPAGPMPTTVKISSGQGEIRSVRLADGTGVILDTNSQIEVAMNMQDRHIRLTKGHIRLAVANDPRPFRVEAGPGLVTAPPSSPASFDVGYDNGRGIRFAMITGKAEAGPVLQTASWSGENAVLAAGQALGWPAERFLPIRTSNETDRIDASEWPTGWVSYHSVALADLIAQANRYTTRPILLGGSDIAQMKVTGRFHVSEPDRLAGNIADVFGLERSDTKQAIVLRTK